MTNELGYIRFRGIDGNGDPIRGGKLYTYDAGTSNDRTTYTDNARTVPHTNPIILDSEGEALIYLKGEYKMNLTTSADAQVPGWPIDNIEGIAGEDTFATEHNADGTHGGAFIWKKGADVTSAATLTLGTDGNYFDILATNTITAIATLGIGSRITLHFDAALTLTHNATDLVLPGGVDIITRAGDEYEFYEYATGDWRLIGGNNRTFNGVVKWLKGADVISGTALPLISDGNYFDVTGATTITSMDSLGVGTVVKLHFDAALQITHHATNLILPGGVNITTVAGDELEFTEYASGDWRMTGGNSISLDRLAVSGAITVSGAAASPPVANVLYKDNVVKGWCSYNGGTPAINDSFNVDSLTDHATGDYTVVWDLDFADANYAVTGGVGLASNPDRLITIKAIAAGSVRLVTGAVAPTLVDMANSMVIAMGDQ